MTTETVQDLLSFADVTSLWKLSNDAWIYIAHEATKRQNNHVIKIEDEELEHGHLYSINQEIFVFWNGYLIKVLKRFL